jgi:plasmid rolling circle replication initiator protein Rep
MFLLTAEQKNFINANPQKRWRQIWQKSNGGIWSQFQAWTSFL